MANITTALRAALRAVLADTSYDVDTIRVARDGTVSALRDADKTFNAPETTRYHIGHIDEIVTLDGRAAA